MNTILEISNRKSKGGRRKISLVLHEIPSDVRKVNRNGIHWSEENTLKNIETVKGIPICAEFASEDKELPLGHGYTSTVEIDGKMTPVFENSEVCGFIDHGEVRDVEVGGEKIRALVGVGYLYEQRYPKFVQWVRSNVETSSVDTSVEIVGYEENDNKIIYEAGECSEDYRCPKEYQYSGTAILSVLPADENAIVLECAEAKDKSKGEKLMTEQEIMKVVTDAISEANSVNADRQAEIDALNNTIAEKDAQISELNASLETVNAELAEAKTAQEAFDAEKAELNKELCELRAEKRIGELNEALADYSEEEKKYAEVEINAFMESPIDGDIDAIKSKICVGIVEKNKADAKVAEQNSANDVDAEDIFSEINSFENEDKEDDNIF